LAAVSFDASNNPLRAAGLKTLQDQTGVMARVVEAIADRMAKSTVQTFSPSSNSFGPMGAGGTMTAGTRHANRNDVFEVEVEGKKFRMSLKEAREVFDKLNARTQEVARIQKELADLLERRKHLAEKDVAERDRLDKQARDLQNELDMKQKYLPGIAEA